jgi:hypothetical protein
MKSNLLTVVTLLILSSGRVIALDLGGPHIPGPMALTNADLATQYTNANFATDHCTRTDAPIAEPRRNFFADSGATDPGIRDNHSELRWWAASPVC